MDVHLVTDAVRRELRLGEVCARFRYAVTANDVERFALATGDRSGPWATPEDYVSGRLPAGAPAPPGYYLALDPYERGDLEVEEYLTRIPYRPTGGGNAYNHVRYARPIRVGDDITVEVSYTDAYEKDGRSGRLLFRVRQNVYLDARGAIVAESECCHIRSYDLSEEVADAR